MKVLILSLGLMSLTVRAKHHCVHARDCGKTKTVCGAPVALPKDQIAAFDKGVKATLKDNPNPCMVPDATHGKAFEKASVVCVNHECHIK